MSNTTTRGRSKWVMKLARSPIDAKKAGRKYRKPSAVIGARTVDGLAGFVDHNTRQKRTEDRVNADSLRECSAKKGNENGDAENSFRREIPAFKILK
jgi:hypothetical protein